MGLLCLNYWLLEAKLSSMTPNLTNELMAIKVKNFKTVGEKNATNSQKKRKLINSPITVKKIQCFIVDLEKKKKKCCCNQYDPSNKGV
jgi:hypothetical protein